MFTRTAAILTDVLILAGGLTVHPLAGQTPPRDPRPPQVTTTAISALVDQVNALMAKGDLDQAEATLVAAMGRHSQDVQLLIAAAALYSRKGDFKRSIEAVETAERLSPGDREKPHMVAVYYWEKVFRDSSLSDGQKHQYLAAGVAASDRALAIDRDYADALTYKNILRRLQATIEADPIVRQQLITEADALRARAMALGKAQRPTRPNDSRTATPPPPPPGYDGQPAPVRVGGNIAQPAKVRDVRPVYPPEAQNAGVSGVVICEVTIAMDGRVADVRVLRSIPTLDTAAVEAVRQWEFRPTYLNGQAVPVIMTVTVNFTLQ